MSEIPEIPFNDIDAINTHVSEEFGDWGQTVEVTQDMINQFAETTGDHQWIHVDVERATAESPFGGPIAHGFLTLSLLPMISVQPVMPTGISGAINYGAEGLRFLSPVPAGSTLHARSRLMGASAHKMGTLITTENAIHVVDVEKPALLYKMQVLFM